MKISKQKLNQIIKEELNATLEEGWLDNLRDRRKRAKQRRRDKKQGIGQIGDIADYDDEATWQDGTIGPGNKYPAGPVDLDLSDEEEDVAIELDPETGSTEIDLSDEDDEDSISTAMDLSPVSGPDPDEDDEDLKATTVVPPVSGPSPGEEDDFSASFGDFGDDEDLKATTVVPPVSAPGSSDTPPSSRKLDRKTKRSNRKADAAARKSGQTYPATELTALAATLRNVATKSGVPFPGPQGGMVKALEKVLRSGGYALDEARDERVFIGQEGNIEISAQSAPQFVKWLAQVKEKAPDVFASLAARLSNYRFDLPAELASPAASEDDEDLKDTTVVSPVDGPAATDDDEDLKATTVVPPAAGPSATSASGTAKGDVMPISGTEFQTMQHVAKKNGTDILKAIRSGVANIGAAAKDEASQLLVKQFNKEFFPALVKMTKNPNIDIAEGVDMDIFLEDLLAEQNEPLTRRQQSHKKGQARGRLGAQTYFKSVKGKPPMIVNQIIKALEPILTKGVTADADGGVLFDAAAEVSSQIKNPKEKAQYEKQYTDIIDKNPAKRVQLYKQNVAAFIQAVAQIAIAAAASVMESSKAAAPERKPLPESVTYDRWKVLSGIK